MGVPFRGFYSIWGIKGVPVIWDMPNFLEKSGHQDGHQQRASTEESVPRHGAFRAPYGFLRVEDFIGLRGVS